MPKLKDTASSTLSEKEHQLTKLTKKYLKRDVIKPVKMSQEDLSRLHRIYTQVQAVSNKKLYYSQVMRAALVICEKLSPERILKAIDYT
jgi:hypothetical protein